MDLHYRFELTPGGGRVSRLRALAAVLRFDPDGTEHLHALVSFPLAFLAAGLSYAAVKRRRAEFEDYRATAHELR